MKKRSNLPRVLLSGVALIALSSGVAFGGSYLILSQPNTLPERLKQSVQQAGGTVTANLPQIGVAVAESTDPAFRAKAARKAGIQAVVPNARWVPQWPTVSGPMESSEVQPAGVGWTEPYYGYQWALWAIDAPGAWSAGQFGAGVRVAVLDSGIATNHIDIAANLNVALSTSFVLGEAFDVVPFPTGFNHGTHVAGIIAAPVNGWGTAGLANEAEIVAVKVLSAVSGSGSFDGVIQGIVYAADIDADVINMSLGAVLPRTGFWDDNGTPDDPSDDVWVGASEVSWLVNALSRATTYAYQQGTVVVAAAGNDHIDRDHDGSLLSLPADCTHVIAVAATGPVGLAYDPNPNLDLPASYSNYGQSRIDFAAPGGDFQLAPEDPMPPNYPYPLWFFDMVLSPGGFSEGNPAWYFAAGTSMAAPHVSAVAALIIGKHGGSMAPDEVWEALRTSADDLGKPGKDDFYGLGRVNAAKAVQ